ncbi:MAG: YkgJ family cysteine cluster protein [Gammaproteobacteria bacterium]
MSDKEKLIEESPLPDSPVIPAQLLGDAVIQFRCHKDIDCFNACCKNIDIMLTPYDIIRLKKRLGITSTEFLRLYTEPFEFGKNSVAGVKYKPKEGTNECQFVTAEGCSVYTDRPTACRYYPIGLLSTRRQDENFDRASYALVTEDHCHGHFEDRKLTIDEYREEQGLEDYDELGRPWRQLILKVKSAGPAIGNMSKTSLRFFFMACYDMDRFREFVKSEGFSTTYDVDQETMDRILEDDLALLEFGDRMIRQIMYAEETIPLKSDAMERHLSRRGDRKSTEHDDMARPSMASYEMPLDGDDEKTGKK